MRRAIALITVLLISGTYASCSGASPEECAAQSSKPTCTESDNKVSYTICANAFKYCEVGLNDCKNVTGVLDSLSGISSGLQGILDSFTSKPESRLFHDNLMQSLGGKACKTIVTSSYDAIRAQITECECEEICSGGDLVKIAFLLVAVLQFLF